MDTNNNNTDTPMGMPPVAPQTFSPEPNNGLNQQITPISTPMSEPSTPIVVSPPVDPPVQASHIDMNSDTDKPTINPMPVVRVLSPRGVEYVFLIIALFTAASSLIGAIISLIEGQTSFSVLAYPTAALVISLPTFALLFLRLKRAEVNDPNSRLDPSKRRSTQFTQIVSFLICFFVLIGVVSAIFAKMSGTYSGSMMKLAMDALVVEVVFGGILFYYWRDEHRQL